jgi:hypothetical protein
MQCPVCKGTCPQDRCLKQLELPLIPPAANLLEFRAIQKFTAACRQQWPGAVITLRPNSEFVHQHEDPPAGDLPAPMMTDERLSDGQRNEVTGSDADGIR